MLETYKIEIKWALILLIATLIWMVGEKLSGLHDQYLYYQQYLTLLFLIPVIVIYYFALREKKINFYQNEMNYKQGLISGLVMTSIITIFSAPNQYIISTIITPDYFDNVIKYVIEHKMMTEEAAKAQFNLQNYMIKSAVGAAMFGIVINLITAFFLKSKEK